MKAKCVICGLDTIYHESDPTDFRYGWVEGLGQLCIHCFEPKYRKSVVIPIVTILATPNDADLGALVREKMNMPYDRKEEQTNHL